MICIYYAENGFIKSITHNIEKQNREGLEVVELTEDEFFENHYSDMELLINFNIKNRNIERVDSK